MEPTRENRQSRSRARWFDLVEEAFVAALSTPIRPDMKAALKPIVPRVFRWQSRLSGPHHPVNSYVVLTPEGVVLIDPAADLTPKVLPEMPRAILLTHVQEEHLAGAFHYPRVPIYVPAGDEYLCAGRDSYGDLITAWEEPWPWDTRGNFRGHLAGAQNERPPLHRLPVTGTIASGDQYFGLRAVSTPGHGKHALTYLLDQDSQRLAFCGDLICGDGQLWNWFDAEWDYGLELGQRSLFDAAGRLMEERCNFLLPSHGGVISEPQAALAKLRRRLWAVLNPSSEAPGPVVNFEPEPDSAPGWRRLSRHLHQWCREAGNSAVLVSETGNALFVDYGLCYWHPLAERAAHQTGVLAELKRSLGIRKVEICIPTHYHGDHIENIPALVAAEGTEIVCLDAVAEAISHPERHNLACHLWWYGTGAATVPVHRSVPSGTRLRWQEYELEIFHLGGQTYHHAGINALIDGRHVLFVGDAIYGWNSHPDPVLCYNDAEPETRGWLYALHRIQERKPDLLVCGHASALAEPALLIEAKIRNWNQRIEEYASLDVRGNARLFFDPFVGATGSSIQADSAIASMLAAESPNCNATGNTTLRGPRARASAA